GVTVCIYFCSRILSLIRNGNRKGKMGGMAIFALALVPLFFLFDPGNAASIPSRDGIKSHKSQKVIEDKE
ncbi:hypothetical protein HAX54_046363, partial [Datura stramonium]|nr:hypothetical protein [Datura stramonium]